jgi:hypothetical protein
MTNVVDFYQKFSCIGADCPFTCCKGWGIAIDEASYEGMKKERGLLGARLRLFSYKKKNTGPAVRRVAEHVCPFFTETGLCELQCKGKEELMPKVCRVFPRRCVSYGKYREASLELACFQAASLFVWRVKKIPSKGDITYMETDLPVEPYYEAEHVDEELLAFFRQDRDRVMTYWNSMRDDWGTALTELYEHTYLKQQLLGKGDLEAAGSLSLPLTAKEKEAASIPKVSRIEDGYAFFPITLLNSFLYGRLSESCTRTRNPQIHRLIKDYKKQFGGILESQADGVFAQKLEKMFKELPELKTLFHAYFGYIYMQSALDAQRDCYILGPVLKSMVSLEFLMLFFVVAYESGAEINDCAKAAIICATEKAVRHSNSFQNDVVKRIREEFFRPRRAS